ncbi:MAG: hypothetical protein JSR17_05235 [Proteobacteria bacterium]|nr:hypothetical protein [Pseudomonadota bacterium]
MLGRNFLHEASSLANKYPVIFEKDVKRAQLYLVLLENLKEIDSFFSTNDHPGKKPSHALLKFLSSNLQFESMDNLLLTTLDIIRYGNACKTIHDSRVKPYVDKVLSAAKELYHFVETHIIKDHYYVSADTLSELNFKFLKKLETLERENKHPRGRPK